MKKLLVFASAVLLLFAISAFIPSCSEMAIYDDVIRLHVLANSDSEYDQSLKLYVRDAVLSYVDGIISAANNKEEAEALISDATAEIESVAKSAVIEYGGDYDVTVTLSKEEYPRKSYGAVTLPSGTYTSLRVMIGDAEGANWWCVLFPRLCTSLALEASSEDDDLSTGDETTADQSADESNSDEAADEEEYVAAGFTPPEYRIITKSDDEVTYTVKFRIIEIIESIISAFGN
ncbi:MAG: stage II sporulation protein R [Clostridia bacterium]|nr:stage II sporulation protein R [Clostridia bacterium]